MFAVVLATAPANITLSTPQPGQNATSANIVTFAVPKGMSQLNYRLIPGNGMRATLTRAGKTVVDVNPTTYNFNPNPSVYNYNAFVAGGKSS